MNRLCFLKYRLLIPLNHYPLMTDSYFSVHCLLLNVASLQECSYKQNCLIVFLTEIMVEKYSEMSKLRKTFWVQNPVTAVSTARKLRTTDVCFKPEDYSKVTNLKSVLDSTLKMSCSSIIFFFKNKNSFATKHIK